MNHQNWEQVVFRKNDTTNKTTPHFERSKTQQLDQETENLNHEKVGVSLGKTIQNARIANGYKTQKELANVINVDVKTISEYESGKAIPDNKILQKLRRVLKTKL
jgi:putative transcription factor